MGIHQYFITGTSRGIGKAIAEILLQDKNNRIVGFSRTCNIQHDNYTHVELDLADLDKVSSIKFPKLENSNSITLINNAGTIGDVRYIGLLEENAIIQNFNVNLLAPSILTNNFIKSYAQINANKLIVNISSGAGKNPVDGWGTYCASKAALDMYSKVVASEQKINNSNFKIFSIAPGVVDTQMQVEIRSADKQNFSRLDEFISYKKTETLANAYTVAQKYVRIIQHPAEFSEVVFSVKDIM